MRFDNVALDFWPAGSLNGSALRVVGSIRGTQAATGSDVDFTAPTTEGLPLGEIKVRIFDASTRTEVWRGSTVSHIDLTRDIDDGLLQRTVQGVLGSFPTRNVTAVQPESTPVAASGASSS